LDSEGNAIIVIARQPVTPLFLVKNLL